MNCKTENTFGWSALLLAITALALALMLASCQTSKPVLQPVGVHSYSHDARTRHEEPAPSHIR